MKIFTVTLSGKDYEVLQGDDGVFSLPESLEYAVGVGTALKPAIEPIILARKPLDGTVAANVLAHGVGGLNIDASRVGTDGGTRKGTFPKGKSEGIYGDGINGACEIQGIGAGRFPANVLLDEHAAKEMDEQSGALKSGARSRVIRPDSGNRSAYGTNGGEGSRDYDANEGGASRFFPVFKYQAKAPKKERPVIERPPMLQLRDDLTPEQVDHVRARLQEVGIEIE